jgi:hypothetical protein
MRKSENYYGVNEKKTLRKRMFEDQKEEFVVFERKKGLNEKGVWVKIKHTWIFFFLLHLTSIYKTKFFIQICALSGFQQALHFVAPF